MRGGTLSRLVARSRRQAPPESASQTIGYTKRSVVTNGASTPAIQMLRQ